MSGTRNSGGNMRLGDFLKENPQEVWVAVELNAQGGYDIIDSSGDVERAMALARNRASVSTAPCGVLLVVKFFPGRPRKKTNMAHACEAPDCEDEADIQAESGGWYCDRHFEELEEPT